MKKRPNCIFLTAAALMLSLPNPSQAEELVILHTNDTHGCIIPERTKDPGGILRRKVLIDSVRSAEKHSLLVDAGDNVQGFMYFTLYGGEVEYELMNRLGYDITIPGNHEFDNGLQALAGNYRHLKADVLCANYDFTGTPMQGLTKNFIINEYDGKRIALIGIGCQPKGMISDENIEGVAYSDAMTVADNLAGTLKKEEKADYAIVISHIGYTTDVAELPCDSTLAATSRHIDLIIGGHSHTKIDPDSPSHPNFLIRNRIGKTVLVAQTGKWGESVGKITIDLDELDEVPEYELLPVDSRYDNRTDAGIAEWLHPYTAGVEKRMNEIIGKSETAMTNDGLGPLTNWVADVVFEIGTRLTDRKIDMAIVNKGGIRREMPEGDVSQGLIETMLPFANSVLVMEISGKDLIAGLNIMAKRNGDAVSRQVSAGMQGGQAVNPTVNGKPIDPNRIYTLATIDYLANGGDYMEPFTRGKTIARSEELLKTDVVNHIKFLSSKGIDIKPDHTQRMYFITK